MAVCVLKNEEKAGVLLDARFLLFGLCPAPQLQLMLRNGIGLLCPGVPGEGSSAPRRLNSTEAMVSSIRGFFTSRGPVSSEANTLAWWKPSLPQGPSLPKPMAKEVRSGVWTP